MDETQNGQNLNNLEWRSDGEKKLDVRFYPDRNRKALNCFKQGIIAHLYKGLQIQMFV